MDIEVSGCHLVMKPRPMLSSPLLCSPDGYLYEREAILEYILHQKKEIARQMKVMGTEEKGRDSAGQFLFLRALP